MINQKTTWVCTDCGEPIENDVHAIRYVAGFGFIVKSGEFLCDKCLFAREVKYGLKSDLKLVVGSKAG